LEVAKRIEAWKREVEEEIRKSPVMLDYPSVGVYLEGFLDREPADPKGHLRP
jgi:hypothetical protein